MPPRPRSLRNRLLSPLVVAGALLLLLEEWCWELGLALARRLAGWPPFAALDRRIAALPPYPALCLFVLPALLLLPVKLLALFAIAPAILCWAWQCSSSPRSAARRWWRGSTC